MLLEPFWGGSSLTFTLPGAHRGEDGGDGVGPQVAHTPAVLEAGRLKMVAAEVLVAGGHPVLLAHLRQPLPQPRRVLQREPGGGRRELMGTHPGPAQAHV